MSFTPNAKPASNFAKQARALSGKTGRFNVAKFGQARFGTTDSWDRTPRPRLGTSLPLADVAQADIAVIGTGWNPIPRT